jgi:hypothetical protein
VRLQAGVNMLVTAQCAQLLGAHVDQGPPAGPFFVPDEVSSVNCALSTAAAVRFSHHRTRLAVTALPGDIGGLSPELDDQYGTGWGVQFPIDPAVGPEHASITRSQLFRGGLIVGIRPNRVLSGIGIDGYFLCAPACRDFGFDGTVKVKTSDKQGTTVTWRYSDARSVEGVGLKVKQKSYDGSSGDYVLFRFTLTNTRSAAVTFYAGMFADWDIDDDALDDIGATDLGGRLMYMTNVGGGTAAGALVVSTAPVSGNTFFTDFNQTTETLVSALAGDFSVPSVGEPNDHRFVNSVGPITLRRDASADVWIAIVAGEDVSQLMSNAAAASVEIARRRGEKDDSNEGVPGDSVRAGTHTVRPGIAPTCKRGCSQ